MARKRLGELLLERGAISAAQLEAALTTQRSTRQRLGLILVEQGALSEAGLVRALAEALSIREVDLAQVQPEWSAVHTLRARLCEQHELFPYALDGDKKGRRFLHVAMADPLNMAAIEEIEFTTGLKVVPYLAPRSAVRQAILRWYHKVSPEQAGSAGQLVQPGGAPVAKAEGEVLELTGEEVVEGEEVVVGEMLPQEKTERTSVAELIERREAQRRAKREKAARTSQRGVVAELSRDLDYLFGMREEGDSVEELERKFWALLRLMARKGLISAEEFTRELDQETEENE